jgi:hypothetical protein
VFGALGHRVGSIKKAWETAVLKAHGHQPRWDKGALHANEMGLQESMRLFDARRGKSVANDPPMEHQPDGYEDSQPPSKDLLH